MAERILSAEYVRELFDYDPETGILTWKVTKWAGQPGRRAGTLDKVNGYRRVEIDRVRYPEHRVIYLWMTGHMPPEHTDHRNGVKDDNRWCNLRAVTNAENQKHRATLRWIAGHIGWIEKRNPQLAAELRAAHNLAH